MEQNNKLQANPEYVINNLISRISQLEKDNAILMSLLQQSQEEEDKSEDKGE